MYMDGADHGSLGCCCQRSTTWVSSFERVGSVVCEAVRLVNSGAISCCWLVEAVSLEPTRIPLVIPLARARSTPPRLEKPEGVACWVLSFSPDHATCQADVFVACPLVKIAFDRGFKTTGTLVDHLMQVADFFEVRAVTYHAVHAYIANHQHPELTFTFGLGTHQSSQ